MAATRSTASPVRFDGQIRLQQVDRQAGLGVVEVAQLGLHGVHGVEVARPSRRAEALLQRRDGLDLLAEQLDAQPAHVGRRQVGERLEQRAVRVVRAGLAQPRGERRPVGGHVVGVRAGRP